MPVKHRGDYRVITVPEALIGRAGGWGEATQKKMKARADIKRVAGHRTSAQDRAIGKIGEVALAILLGLDPETAVEWRPLSGGDGHRDLTVTVNNSPKIVDVKASAHPAAELLIWPRTQSFDYMADFLVFAKVAALDGDRRGKVFIPGFITKMDFIRGNKKMDLRHDGRLTPAMNWRDLMPIHILKNATRTCRECGCSTPLAVHGAGFCGQRLPRREGANP